MAAVFENNDVLSTTTEGIEQIRELIEVEKKKQYQLQQEISARASARSAAYDELFPRIEEGLSDVHAKLASARELIAESRASEKALDQQWQLLQEALATAIASSVRAIARNDKIIAQSRDLVGRVSASYSSPMLTGATFATVAAAPGLVDPVNSNVESSSSEPDFFV